MAATWMPSLGRMYLKLNIAATRNRVQATGWRQDQCLEQTTPSLRHAQRLPRATQTLEPSHAALTLENEHGTHHTNRHCHTDLAQ